MNTVRKRINAARPVDATGPSQTDRRTHATARAAITVQSSQAKPFDETAKPQLLELRLSETFKGDMDGESPGSGFTGPARR